MHVTMLDTTNPAQPTPRRILICEDNHLIAAGWAMILADAGYEVVGPTYTAESALEAAYKRLPDLALVDISLAGDIDGISVAAELAPMGVPIVFVTADYQRAAEEGREFAADILIKPVRQHSILSALAAVLLQRQGAD